MQPEDRHEDLMDKRVERFVSWYWPSLKSCAKKVQQAVTVFNKKPETSTFPGDTPKAVLARQAISELRLLLPDVSRFDSRAHKTLALYFHILKKTEEELARRREFEKENPNQKRKRFNGRLFNILPLKSNYTLSYVPLSTMAYMQVLLDCKLVKYSGTEGAAKLDHLKLWGQFFNLNAVETKNRRFAGMICTDGCAVSVLMTQCSADKVRLGESSPEVLRAMLSDPRTLVVAVDPGVTRKAAVLADLGTTRIPRSSSRRGEHQSGTRQCMMRQSPPPRRLRS